jgi:hypothetical protein
MSALGTSENALKHVSSTFSSMSSLVSGTSESSVAVEFFNGEAIEFLSGEAIERGAVDFGGGMLVSSSQMVKGAASSRSWTEGELSSMIDIFLRGDDFGACASSMASSVTKGELVSSSHVTLSVFWRTLGILDAVEPGCGGEAGLLLLSADGVSGESIVVGWTTGPGRVVL